VGLQVKATPGRWHTSEGFELGLVRQLLPKRNIPGPGPELDSGWADEMLFRKEQRRSARWAQHLLGLHAADIVQEDRNAVARRRGLRELASEVHNPYPPSVNWWRWPNKQAAASFS